jgi:hypothetical protein
VLYFCENERELLIERGDAFFFAKSWNHERYDFHEEKLEFEMQEIFFFSLYWNKEKRKIKNESQDQRNTGIEKEYPCRLLENDIGKRSE